MNIHQGGELYGFCPGKATWDNEAQQVYNMLVVARECGTMVTNGPLTDQPAWWISLLSEFITVYDAQKFATRVRSVLGDGKNNGSKNGRPQRKN